MEAEINVRVNGREHRGSVEPRLLLVHYLRDCLADGHAHRLRDVVCGACTVLLTAKR